MAGKVSIQTDDSMTHATYTDHEEKRKSFKVLEIYRWSEMSPEHPRNRPFGGRPVVKKHYFNGIVIW